MNDDETKAQPAPPIRREPYNLMRDAFSLMQSEPFYARIFAKIDKVATLAIPTAGVRFNKEKLRFELVYNPRFLGSLDRAARIDVLKHEGAHIFLDHCTTRTVAAELHRYWNIATDLAIMPNFKPHGRGSSFLQHGGLPQLQGGRGHALLRVVPRQRALELHRDVSKPCVPVCSSAGCTPH